MSQEQMPKERMSRTRTAGKGTYRHSIRTRVAIAFAICVAVLSVVWGFAFFAAIKLTEDSVLVQQLQRAAASYPVMPEDIKGYEDASELPESLQAWAQTNPTAGVYEFVDEEFHVAVISTTDAEAKPAYVVFDVSEIEAESSQDWWWLLLIMGVVGSLGLAGFGLGMMVMRRAVAPVVELANAVGDIDLARLSEVDHKRIEAKRFGDDEVGVLAETIERTLERISAFVLRERYFTGAASHELRTPLTVISGALELLAQRELAAADVKVLDRVRRATEEMKSTIEMFLALARETDDGLYEAQLPVQPVLNQALEQQQPLLQGKQVNVSVVAAVSPNVSGHPQAFAIAVNNLVRNAFEHAEAEHSQIDIVLSSNELTISNSASVGTSEHNAPAAGSPYYGNGHGHGYGLGLGIVQRLCERNGWTFSFEVVEHKVCARLSW